jgi:hypothetical protein
MAALFAVAGALAACDRHSASEVPESYGHGSAHADAAGVESYDDHRVDSNGPRHFSDTQGTETDARSEAPAAASPSPTAAGTPKGHFF